VAVCPRCGSKDLFSKKFGFGDVSVYEWSCKACDLYEDRSTRDADFEAWYERWHPPDEEDLDREEPPARPAEAEDEDEHEVAFESAAERDELLDAICRDVGNDELRLRYADLIASRLPERAELIRLQIERARRETASGAPRATQGAREAALLERHGKDWARYIAPYARPFASDAPYRGWAFERGFIAELRTDPDMVADPRDYLFRSAPIEHLDLTDDGPVAAAFASPRMAQLRSLGLRALDLGDDDMVALARDARLDRCEWLDLRSNRIGLRGVQALAASERIRTIPIVLLTFNPCDPAVQYDDDHAGSVETWLPPEGADLEATHGRIPWLHLPPVLGRPDRYHARCVRYVDADD
jgi:uncharacterized protein (TIGR02996 family)